MKPQRTQRKTLYSSGQYPFKGITQQIIGSAIEVHSHLGPGLLESVYEEGLAHEFDLRGVRYERQKRVDLMYKGKRIGDHRLDFLVDNEIIVELKSVQAMNTIYEAQLLTYLKAMNKRVGLLINFNVEKLQQGIKRMIL